MNIAHWSNFDTVMWSVGRHGAVNICPHQHQRWPDKVAMSGKWQQAWLFHRALFWPKSLHQGNWPADVTDMQSMPCHMEQLQMHHGLIIYHGRLTKFCVLRPVKIATTALPEFTAHVISNIKLFACFGHGSWQSSSSAKSWICWTNKWWHNWKIC